VNSTFVRQTCCVLNNLIQHFAEVRIRTANKDKDNSQLNQYLFKIPADFSTQCSDAYLISASLRENFTHVHSQIHDDASEALKLPLRGNSDGR